MTPLTPTEIEELRIAIATEVGWRHILISKFPDNDISGVPPSTSCLHHPLPPYTTSIDAIQAACLERLKDEADSVRLHNFLDMTAHDSDVLPWQLTALDWSIAFARTAKIWRYKV